MYRSKESFVTKTYDVKRKEKLEDDFTSQDEINEFLNINYIEEYDGTLEITDNGTYDVTDYDSTNVNVPKGITPTGTINITENGTVDVTNYASANVDVPVGGKYAPRYLTFQIYSGSELDYEVANLDTKNITNMYKMFASARVTSLDLSNWNTSNVTTMSYMFEWCAQLVTLNVNFDTSNVTNISNMFFQCNNIKSLDLSNWNTSKITNMANVFVRCMALTSLNVKGWDTSNVTTMSGMFNTLRLTSLDLSDFTITNATDISTMFANSTNLLFLDIRNMVFSTKTNLNTSNMFGTNANTGVPNNCEIIVKDDTEKAWINTNFSRLTNVKTVAEYEAE